MATLGKTYTVCQWGRFRCLKSTGAWRGRAVHLLLRSARLTGDLVLRSMGLTTGRGYGSDGGNNDGNGARKKDRDWIWEGMAGSLVAQFRKVTYRTRLGKRVWIRLINHRWWLVGGRADCDSISTRSRGALFDIMLKASQTAACRMCLLPHSFRAMGSVNSDTVWKWPVD